LDCYTGIGHEEIQVQQHNTALGQYSIAFGQHHTATENVFYHGWLDCHKSIGHEEEQVRLISAKHVCIASLFVGQYSIAFGQHHTAIENVFYCGWVDRHTGIGHEKEQVSNTTISSSTWTISYCIPPKVW
jgi:nitrate/TMAO reductase-like tetraheme cytochrome c subunit